MIQFEEHIFWMGWFNHQLDQFVISGDCRMTMAFLWGLPHDSRFTGARSLGNLKRFGGRTDTVKTRLSVNCPEPSQCRMVRILRNTQCKSHDVFFVVVAFFRTFSATCCVIICWICLNHLCWCAKGHSFRMRLKFGLTFFQPDALSRSFRNQIRMWCKRFWAVSWDRSIAILVEVIRENTWICMLWGKTL